MTYATDRLIRNARTSLPGSLDNVIQLELFNVLDEFFKNTDIWMEDIPFPASMTDPAGTIYYIEPESVSSIVRLHHVTDGSNFRQRATMAVPGEIVFALPPSQDGTFTARVALTIIDPTNSDGFPEFPDWVLDKYGVGILDGVLGRMMAQPAKPYTNAKLAEAHYKFFYKTISDASTEAVHRNVHGAQSWVYPQHFATRGQRR